MNTVQVGALTVSKSIVDALFPLLGVIIGGLVTYYTTRSLESRKWKLEKDQKIKEQKREALALALEWVSPLRNEVIRASGVSIAYQKGTITEEEYRKRQPTSTGLPIVDPPAKLRVFLPADIYPKLLDIVRSFDDLYYDGFCQREGGLVEVLGKNTELKRKLDEMEDRLVSEYRATFG
jgi:hypothetical protein